MLFTALYYTMLSMGPYYLQSTYKWFKMALWDAPTRILLDVQLEQLRLERNLSHAGQGESQEAWKNTFSHWLRTNSELHSVRLPVHFATTFSVLFGKKLSTVLYPLNHPQPLKNAKYYTLDYRFLYPETCFNNWSCEWLWWEEVHWDSESCNWSETWKS